MSLRSKFNFAAKVAASAVAGRLIKAGVVMGAGALGISAAYGVAIAAGGAALTSFAITTFEYSRDKDKKLWSKDHRKALLKGMATSGFFGGALAFLTPGLEHILADAWHSETAESIKNFFAVGSSNGAPVIENMNMEPSSPDTGLETVEKESPVSPDIRDEITPSSPTAEDAPAPVDAPAAEAPTETPEESSVIETTGIEKNAEPELKTIPAEPSAEPVIEGQQEDSANVSEDFNEAAAEDTEDMKETPVFEKWEDLTENNLQTAIQQFVPEQTSPVLEDVLSRMESSNEIVRAQAVKDFAHGLYNGEYGLPENDTAAFAINHLAVEISKGENAQAVFNEALSYLHGLGAEADYEKAREGFEKALSLGYDRSCEFLQYMEDIGKIDGIPAGCESPGQDIVMPEPIETEPKVPVVPEGPEIPKADAVPDNQENICFENDRLEKLWWSTNPDGCLEHYSRTLSP